VPRKKTSRIPKKFARKVTPDTKRFVKRKMDRKQKRKKDQWKRKVRKMQMYLENIRSSAAKWTAVTILLTGTVVFCFLLFSPIIQLREIKVTRLSPRLDIEEVQNTLSSLFGRHLFFLSSFEVTSLLEQSITDIETVSIGKEYSSVLHVRIALQPLVARLRIIEPDDIDMPLGTGSTIDYVTEEGVYVTTTAAKDTKVLPEILIVDWGVRPVPGSLLIIPAFIERMNAAEIAFLRQFGQEVERRTVFVRAQEFHLRIGDRDLWFDLKSPLEDQLERYRTFLREVDIAETKDYVDLRVTDRVIYQ